jgi:hypothetical protein
MVIWAAPSGVVDTVTVSGSDEARIGFTSGTYQLIVRSPGYVEWQASPAVTRNGCASESMVITAALVRASP